MTAITIGKAKAAIAELIEQHSPSLLYVGAEGDRYAYLQKISPEAWLKKMIRLLPAKDDDSEYCINTGNGHVNPVNKIFMSPHEEDILIIRFDSMIERNPQG